MAKDKQQSKKTGTPRQGGPNSNFKRKQNRNAVSAEDEIAALNARIASETPALGSAPPAGVVAFASLPLSNATLSGLAQADYTTMTAIQSASIPHALAGRDILGAAKTGSGKTLSFVVPILECLYRHQWSGKTDGPGAVVLSPTRELAGQIFSVLRLVGAYHKKSLSVGLLVGGKNNQRDHNFQLEQQNVPYTNIIIATPGRLLQHLEQTPSFDLDNLKMLVLDEADRILDMGFRDQLVRILDYLPSNGERQTLLFSATQTRDVSHLATLSMNRKNLEYVGVHDKANFDTPDTLQQSYVVVPVPHKLNCVYSFLKSHLRCKTIIFFATCSQVRHAWELFCSLRPGVSVMALHGKLCQSKRNEVYDKFVRLPHSVLFATDIASRGLDFPDVDWVVQVDAPEDQDMYIHRVGRTARYKNKGNSLLILDPLEEGILQKWMTSKKLPIKKKSINPTKTVLVTQRAASLVAGDVKLHQLAKKAFTSYVRSISLLPKLEFNVKDMDLAEYATSLGLATMPNLRFLENVSTREVLRKTKNVNRKLQKLKEQIKAEKLAKKIAKLGNSGSVDGSMLAAKSSDKKRKGRSDDASSSDDDDDLLVVKSRHGPLDEHVNQERQSGDTTSSTEYFSINEVSKSRHTKKIRVESSASNKNKHIVFDDDGTERPNILTASSLPAIDATENGQDSLEHASKDYVEQVRQRLERTKELDKREEKQRIREKHRKKRMQDKAANMDESDSENVGMVATLGQPQVEDSSLQRHIVQEGHLSESSSTGSHDDVDSTSSSDDGQGQDLEDMALSLIRGAS